MFFKYKDTQNFTIKIECKYDYEQFTHQKVKERLIFAQNENGDDFEYFFNTTFLDT